MIENYFRSPFQRLLIDTMTKKLTRVLPSSVTLLSAIFGIAVPIALGFRHEIVAILLLLLSGYCDILDGALARHQNRATDFGAALDILCDRIVEFSVILGLYLVAPPERGLVAIFMLGSVLLCITSFLIVGIFTKNDSHKSFYYSPGLMERAEAFMFFIAMMVWPHYFNWLGITFSLLVLWTAFYRLFEFRLRTLTPSAE